MFTGYLMDIILRSLFIYTLPWSKLGGNNFTLEFPGGLDGKAAAYNVGDPGLIPGLERSPGEGNGNPLQCSCLENPLVGGSC